MVKGRKRSEKKMRALFQLMKKQVEKQADFMIVSVVSSSGSAPRSQGAWMLIGEEGRISGTIGGGAIEYQSERLAQQLLQEKSSHLEKFRLYPNEIADIGMICGGNVDIFFQYVDAQSIEICQLMTLIEEQLDNNECGWLIYKIKEPYTHFGFYSRQTGVLGIPQKIPDKEFKFKHKKVMEDSYYLYLINNPSKVYIFGGGHVAQALVPILMKLSFTCVVLDDRADFLSDFLFPPSAEKRLVDFEAIEQTVHITENDYAIVMTRGHLFDLILEKQLLQTPALYIGVMGSRHKVASHHQLLKEANFSQTEIDRLNMPIGLAIGAQTPEELAISIAGELIEVRAEKNNDGGC